MLSGATGEVGKRGYVSASAAYVKSGKGRVAPVTTVVLITKQSVLPTRICELVWSKLVLYW